MSFEDGPLDRILLKSKHCTILQQTTLQGLLLGFGRVRWEWPSSPEKPLRDVGTHTLAPITKSVAPKVQFPLDLSGSAWLTTLKFIRMDDGQPSRGNIYWQSEWSHPPEFPLCSVPSIILGIVLNSFEYEGTLLSPYYIPLNKSRNVLFWLLAYFFPPFHFFPHKIRINMLLDWFKLTAKATKKSRKCWILSLGGGKVSKADTKGIQEQTLKLLC